MALQTLKEYLASKEFELICQAEGFNRDEVYLALNETCGTRLVEPMASHWMRNKYQLKNIFCLVFINLVDDTIKVFDDLTQIKMKMNHERMTPDTYIFHKG